MPHILLTTQIRLEAGPCIVGDEHSDPELMKYLRAEQRRENGQFFKVILPFFSSIDGHFLSAYYWGLGNKTSSQRSAGPVRTERIQSGGHHRNWPDFCCHPTQASRISLMSTAMSS